MFGFMLHLQIRGVRFYISAPSNLSGLIRNGVVPPLAKSNNASQITVIRRFLNSRSNTEIRQTIFATVKPLRGSFKECELLKPFP